MGLSRQIGEALEQLDPWRRALASTVAVVTAITIPVFLVSTLAVQIGKSLELSPFRLGLLVAAYYVIAALVSVPSGRLADRVGGLIMLRLGGWAAAIIMLAMALFARSWPILLGLLAFAGIASSASQPAANLYLIRTIPPHRQGFAFGIKQASIPACALLGGLAVPAIALTVGWRWAFVGAATLAVLSCMSLPSSPTQSAKRQTVRAQHEGMLPPLVMLAAGFTFGLIAASSLATFLVIAGTQIHLSPSDAGLVAALAGATGVAARLAIGWAADRRSGVHLLVVAGMLALGTVGYLGLALATAERNTLLFILSAVLAAGMGWGWNGLANFAVARTHLTATAWATGVTQTGGRLGSMLGPLTFGLLATHISYQAGWIMAAVAASVAAVAMTLAYFMTIRARDLH